MYDRERKIPRGLLVDIPDRPDEAPAPTDAEISVAG
jgi:hypothetical protein